jgi:DNA-binding HxlR family transcriptional regulator
VTRRSYDQFCGLAGALDAVGERWTLLVVRDLMGGAKRYSDLASSLHGIGTSLLAARLKQLETDGLIARRDLPPPAASTVYELTPVGWELADALVPLAVWGARHQLGPERTAAQRFKPEWSLAALARQLRSTFPGARSARASAIGARPATMAARVPESGATVAPADAVVTTDSGTLAAIVAGRAPIADALADGRLTFEGDEETLVALASALPQASTSAAGPVS